MKKILFGIFIIASACLSVGTTKANGHIPVAPGIFQDTTHKMSFTRKGATKPAMQQPKPLPIVRDTVKAAPKPAAAGVKTMPVKRQPVTVKPVTTPAATSNQ